MAAGEILITQAKALAGNVTPGDAAGFPVKLSLPGVVYELADDLSPGPGVAGLVAAAPDITIDLKGFRLSGGPAGGANNSTYGIVAQSDRLTVQNGTIGAFKSGGIAAANLPYLIVENVRIINGGGFGINNPGGSFARIKSNTIATNLGNGIVCGNSCHVEGNIVSGNGGIGIRISTGSVLGNTIISNTKLGIESLGAVGYGNNTIFNNNDLLQDVGGAGVWIETHPNACFDCAPSP
jgi:hypothetical protein